MYLNSVDTPFVVSQTIARIIGSVSIFNITFVVIFSALTALTLRITFLTYQHSLEEMPPRKATSSLFAVPDEVPKKVASGFLARGTESQALKSSSGRTIRLTKAMAQYKQTETSSNESSTDATGMPRSATANARSKLSSGDYEPKNAPSKKTQKPKQPSKPKSVSAATRSTRCKPSTSKSAAVECLSVFKKAKLPIADDEEDGSSTDDGSVASGNSNNIPPLVPLKQLRLPPPTKAKTQQNQRTAQTAAPAKSFPTSEPNGAVVRATSTVEIGNKTSVPLARAPPLPPTIAAPSVPPTTGALSNSAPDVVENCTPPPAALKPPTITTSASQHVIGAQEHVDEERLAVTEHQMDTGRGLMPEENEVAEGFVEQVCCF